MNKIEKLEQAYTRLDALCTVIEPALDDVELKLFEQSLTSIKEVTKEIQHEATL